MPKIALVVLDMLRKDPFQRQFDWVPDRTVSNAWSKSRRTAAIESLRCRLERPVPTLDGLDRDGTDIDGAVDERLEHLGCV